MSLILEALKKSEAERRRGQSPDLFGATLGTPLPRREIARVWPLLLLGLILLASAWMIWSGGSRGESVPPAESSLPADASVADAAAVTDASDSPTKTSTLAPAASRPVSASSPASAKPTASAKPAASAASQTAPSSAPAAAVPSSAPSSAPSADNAPAAPAEEALPTLSALDAGARAALPPLKLSMHVYADDAAKRFAIIDGQRIGEGALLAGGVVEAIRRDGVVVNINGRRLLLPKP